MQSLRVVLIALAIAALRVMSKTESVGVISNLVGLALIIFLPILGPLLYLTPSRRWRDRVQP